MKLKRKIDNIQRLSVNRSKLEQTSEDVPQWRTKEPVGSTWGARGEHVGHCGPAAHIEQKQK